MPMYRMYKYIIYAIVIKIYILTDYKNYAGIFFSFTNKYNLWRTLSKIYVHIR